MRREIWRNPKGWGAKPQTPRGSWAAKSMKLVLLGILIFSFATPPLRAAVPLLSFEQVAASTKTPQELAALMKKNFHFKEDQKLFSQEDHWQSPEEIWNRKAGDCEDYAIFAQYVLRKHGIEAEVVSFYGAGGYAHTLVMFKENGRFRMLNQHKLERFRAGSIEEALSKLNPQWTWAAIAEHKGVRGYIRETFFNFPPKQTAIPPQPFLL